MCIEGEAIILARWGSAGTERDQKQGAGAAAAAAGCCYYRCYRCYRCCRCYRSAVARARASVSAAGMAGMEPVPQWSTTWSSTRAKVATSADLLAEKSGNICRVGIFLDFVWLTTRTPHEAYVRRAKRTRIGRHRGEIERVSDDADPCTVAVKVPDEKTNTGMLWMPSSTASSTARATSSRPAPCSRESKANVSCCTLRPRTTPPPEESSILGVTHGVLLWADMNAAAPPGSRSHSARCAGKSGNLLRAGVFHDFASSPTRTPHGGASHVQVSGRGRIDPHSGEVERPTTRADSRCARAASTSRPT